MQMPGRQPARPGFADRRAIASFAPMRTTEETRETMDLARATKSGFKASKKAGMNMKKNLAKWELAKALRNLPGWDLDDGLDLVGLQRRPSKASRLLSSAGLVAAGMVVGAAIGMLLAPKSGEQLRRDFRDRASSLRESPSNGSRGQQGSSRS
jgi:hypothetical protein